MNRINFKLVHAFVAVAEQRSFRRASEVLNRSQSGVSLQIRELEGQLGVPLFHRTTRQVRLTAEGEKLLQHARRAMAEWDSGLSGIRESADMLRGTLSIACVPTVADTKLPSILKSFMSTYPGISMKVRELASDDLLEAVRRQEVDFGIGIEVERRNEFQFESLAIDAIYACGEPSFGLENRSHLTLEDLAGMPILLNARSTALRATLDAEIAASNLQIEIKYEVLHTHTALAFARAGLGVAILPGIALPALQNSTLSAVPIGSPNLTRTISIVAMRGTMLSPGATRLKNTVVEAFRRG